MPRIRKKTSNRGTTHQRQRIQHKVAETRKKRKKSDKKNPQRKSTKPKDLGIPNNFPYRDQILAEVAEQRRLAVEEKQKRKEARKQKASAEEEPEEDDAGDIGVSTLVGSSKVKPATVASKAAVFDEEDEAPVLMNPDLPTLEAVIKKSDVVIEILDARDPLAYRSSHLEELVKSKTEKKLLLVLNKIDTCPRESIESWVRALSKEYPVFLFRSASAFLPENESVDPKGKGKKRADDAQGVAVLFEYLEGLVKDLTEERPLNIAVLGWTNVGKSSFVSSLTRKVSLPIYKLTPTLGDGPTTTSYPQEVTLTLKDREVNLIDTPGFSWRRTPEEAEEVAERFRTQDILVRSKGHIERLKDPQPVVHHIVSRAGREDLMLFYNIPAFAEGDVNAFLSGVARANSLIKKGGVLDLTGASKIVLRDWRTGKFPRFTLPSPTLLENAPAVSESNEKILATLKTRREIRNATGVVKLKSGEIERREVELEKTWIDDESSDEEDEEVDELEEDGMDVDEGDEDEDEDVEMDDDDEDEDEDEEEDEEELPQVGKRKRGPSSKLAPVPKKKVAFSAQNAPSSKSSAPAKSILKASEKPKSSVKPKSKSKPTPQPAASVSKVANGKASKGKEEDGAYDFGKFF